MGNDEKTKHLNCKNFNFDELYSNCNDHLMETDRKRDQILVLFVSITGLYIGNVNNLRNISGFNVLAICIVFAGIIFAQVVLNYRKWHLKYHLAAIVIQRLMLIDKESINQKMVTKVLRSIVDPVTFKILFSSTESLIYNLYISINFINIYILLTIFNLENLIIALSLIFYFILMNVFYYRSLKKLCDKKNIKSTSIWIINLFGKEEDY